MDSGLSPRRRTRSRPSSTAVAGSRATRRRFLASVGAVAIGGLAGCFGGDGEDAYYEDEAFVDEDDEPTYDGYLSRIDYPGTVDWTDADDDALVVFVGTGSEGMGYAPRSVRIEAGSTLTWEWTGDGGIHDVVHVDGEFRSAELHDAGETYEYTFEEPGEYAYYCTPHEHRDMKGGVDVV